MKALITTLLIVLIAGTAFAVDSMGISGATDAHTDYINIIPFTPFDFHVVLLDPSSATIGGYECGLGFTNAVEPMVLAVTGPNGWTNFGTPLNHLAGYGTPLPALPMTVLSTLNCMVTAPAPYETLVIMGPAVPSSFNDMGPGYADGSDPSILILCSVPADGVVGTISTEVVATENVTLSGVKALFN